MKKPTPEQRKVASVMHEWGQGKLRSGSAKGPVVKNQKQAVAIGLSEAQELMKKRRGGKTEGDADGKK